MKKIIIILSCLFGLGFVAGCCSIICPGPPGPCARIEPPPQVEPMDMMKVEVIDKATGQKMTIYGFHENELKKFKYNIKVLKEYNQRCFKLTQESGK